MINYVSLDWPTYDKGYDSKNLRANNLMPILCNNNKKKVSPNRPLFCLQDVIGKEILLSEMLLS